MYECNSFIYEAPAAHVSGTKTAGLDETEPEPSRTQAPAAATGSSQTRTESVEAIRVNLGTKRSAWSGTAEIPPFSVPFQHVDSVLSYISDRTQETFYKYIFI